MTVAGWPRKGSICTRGEDKLLRQSHRLDLSDRSVVLIMTQGIGTRLTADEKRAHLIDMRRSHLIDTKPPSTAVSLAGSPSRQQAGAECLGIGQLHEVAHLQIGHSLLHLRVLDADRVGIPFGTPQSDRVIDEIDGGDFGHHGELLDTSKNW